MVDKNVAFFLDEIPNLVGAVARIPVEHDNHALPRLVRTWEHPVQGLDDVFRPVGSILLNLDE